MPPLRGFIRSLHFLIIASALACQGDNLPLGPAVGTLEITASTTGAEPDADGYTVQMDAQPAQAIGATATVQATEITAGNHTVQLAGIAGNCTVVGENPRSITITAGETTTVTFEVTCTSTTGSLRITSTTSGPWPDLDGYTVAVDGNPVAIGINSTSIIPNLAAGVHMVALADMDANCRVNGESSRPVTVAAGEQVIVSFAVFCPAITGRYEATDLGEFDGGQDWSSGYAINPTGQIVGVSGDALNNTRAWRLENGLMADLGTLGGVTSTALAINPSGQVVGESLLAGDGTHAFLWHDGVMADLGALGGTFNYSRARGINPQGQVVGGTSVPGDQFHAFLWHNGIMRDLGTLGGTHSEAYAINREGQVVGYSLTAQGVPRAFLWESGVMTDLGTFNRCCSIATGINRHGQVVGYVFDLYYEGDWILPRAFVWESGVMTELSGRPDYPSVANGINHRGQIVGCIGGQPVIWEGGVPTELGGLSREGGGGCAMAINSAGQVVGETQAEAPLNLIWRATLWTPR